VSSVLYVFFFAFITAYVRFISKEFKIITYVGIGFGFISFVGVAFYLDESALFLLRKGRITQAENIIRRIFIANRKQGKSAKVEL
jgi:hypothetical protein